MTYRSKRCWLSSKSLAANTLAGNQFRGGLIIWLVFLVFFSVSVAAFTPVYIHSFLTDDYKHLGFIQPFMDKPYTVYQAFNPSFLGWYYRPTQLVFFTVFRLLFGTNPVPYYVGLLLLHAVNIVLVYRVGRTWGNGRLGAICATGLFSVIATHQEVVGWISAVSILLAATFSLLSFYHLRIYLNNPQQKKTCLLALLMTILAIFSREEAVVLFPLILFLWLFTVQRRPQKSEVGLFAGLGIFVTFYSVAIFLRPTWTPHADAVLDVNLVKLASIQNLGKFLLAVFSNYLSIENVPSYIGWLTTSLIIGVALAVGMLFWRGKNFLRLGILWSGLLLLFLYVVVWPLTSEIAHRYLYLPWIGITFSVGALADQLHTKSSNKRVLPAIILLVLMGNFLYQTPISRRAQQQWKNDADITTHNATQIKQLVPEINKQTHFFAYNMPPVTDYIQSMAAVWYDVPLEGRGGSWKRLLMSGFATANDYLLNYEDGQVANVMPELQGQNDTIFVWQEDPTAEIIHFDGTSTPLDSGAYQLDQIVGPPGQQRFGFFIHPPNPEDGWASMTYTTAVPTNSVLTFGIRKEWGQIGGEDGITFRVNIINAAGNKQTVYQASIDTVTEGWIDPELPMNDYWQQAVSLQFQVYANGNLLHDHGYWANPRFVITTD